MRPSKVETENSEDTMNKRDRYLEYPEPRRVAVDASWLSALTRLPISDAADAARHDLQRAAHRPGGKIRPRPRFSKDERNRFGNWS